MHRQYFCFNEIPGTTPAQATTRNPINKTAEIRTTDNPTADNTNLLTYIIIGGGILLLLLILVILLIAIPKFVACLPR